MRILLQVFVHFSGIRHYARMVKIFHRESAASHTKRKLQPVFGPLSRLRTGIKAKVVYISTGSQESVDFLSSIGVVPGLTFTVHHRKPSFVIRFGEIQLALDDDIAKYIYVRVINS